MMVYVGFSINQNPYRCPSWLIVGLILGLSSGALGVKLDVGLYSWLSVEQNGEQSGGLEVGLSGGLIVGLIAGLNGEGSAVIKHYALRLTLLLNGDTLFKFVKCLDHCAKLILLKKVGGGYIFIHRMLLEYFAEMTSQETEKID